MSFVCCFGGFIEQAFDVRGFFYYSTEKRSPATQKVSKIMCNKYSNGEYLCTIGSGRIMLIGDFSCEINWDRFEIFWAI